ncbi:uncharacterized protein LOC111302409 [Durio zibethinus]|uniref:Uncharacterized protein LOC111302409 n=1 Tax=Durio zibethinus TaxID=66656 RepID=A0A6P5ZNZ1_DURZI|nr:uncharacterized protein LOC111302409 [Durio zibethinus]
MALINVPTDHIKLRKTVLIEKKPLMLKDYLRDDLSSCSSSGFKSLPRRQCCTSFRFLHEADLKKSKDYSSSTKRLLKRSRSKPASTAISALQIASEAVLNAVKLLPFPSFKSSSPSLQSNSSRQRPLPRNSSSKLFKRSFWRKAEKEDGEIKRWRLFSEFLEEKNQPSDQNTITDVNTTDNSSTTTNNCRFSTSTSSNSWAESEFTADILQSSSGNSESTSGNDTVEGKTNLPEKKKVSNIVGGAVDEDSINNYQKEQDWPNEEGKEQFSPVSVLDCPFDDEEEEVDNSSPFQDQLARVEGPSRTKQKLMQKIRRFESLSQLEPVDLEKRIALAELEDESLESHREVLCLVSVNNNGNMSDYQDKEEKDREANEKLLKLLKSKIPSDSFKFMADNLLLDFFRERLTVENNAKRLADMGLEEFGLDLLKVAEDWVNGNPQELVLGWKLQESRKANVKEMERNENWRNFNEEKEKMGSAVEHEVFISLVDELLTDLF